MSWRYTKTHICVAIELPHLAGRALTSDWSANSFIIVVNLKFSQNFLSKAQLKFFSHRQPLSNNLRTSQKCVLFLQGVPYI